MLKVCFLVGTLARGGAEKQMVFMLRAAQSAGIAVRVLSLTKGEELESEIESRGIRIDYVGASANRWRRLWEVVKNLHSDVPDIIQSSHFYTNIYAGIAGRLCRIPAIGAIRNDLTSELAAHGNFGRFQLFAPTYLIANTEAARQTAIRKGIAPAKIDFVRNVVEMCEEVPKDCAKKVTNVLFVGRLLKQKRPELFVYLAAHLERGLPDYRLNFQIIGSGEMRGELEKLAKDQQLRRNCVLFLGQQSKMSALYQQADLLVLPSAHEGTPNVLLEAMAHGVPIVATKVGGVVEILAETRSSMVAPNDENALVEAVKRLILQPDLRQSFSRRGKEYVRQHHSPDYLQQKLTTIYRRLLKR